MKIKYKNIELNLKGILIRVFITAIIGFLILVILPKAVYIANHPVYKKNMNFVYYYLDESGSKNFNLKKGYFQEIYTRGVGEQRFFIKKETTSFINLHIDCLNKEGTLTIYLKNLSNKINLLELQIPKSIDIVKDFKIKIEKDKNYILILDHKYTDGGFYAEWMYKK